MDMLEFRMKLSKDDMERLRDNSYLIEDREDVTNEEVLKDILRVQSIKECDPWDTFKIESLEIEEIRRKRDDNIQGR